MFKLSLEETGIITICEIATLYSEANDYDVCDTLAAIIAYHSYLLLYYMFLGGKQSAVGVSSVGGTVSDHSAIRATERSHSRYVRCFNFVPP